MNRISILEKPLILQNGITIKNRFFKSAMSEALGSKSHQPTASLITLYRTWAEGGVGLSVTGNVMIDSQALGEPGNVVVEDERDLDMLKNWAKAGTENETQLWMQINHPGKQSPKMISNEPVAPSSIPLTGKLQNFFNTPRALTEEEIKDLIKRFGNSARIAKKAGFTGVQIHAAHGYLINQFLSPYHNQRNDQWGGPLENRMRFVLEVYHEIREQVGDAFPIGIKLNSADFQRGGFTEEESMEVVKKLSEVGIDLIEISGGNYEQPAMMGSSKKESTKKREAYFLHYAEKVRTLINTPLVVTGGFRTVSAMNEAIECGAVDMIGIARPFTLIPDLPNKVFNGTYEPLQDKPIKTGLSLIDNNLPIIEMGWYGQQLKRMGQGKAPKPNLSPWSTLLHVLTSQGKYAFQKKRGL
ncbi:NADH oxidase [Lottiidibacillus patelloidae]|uniref:NADH oxidase n=1 Tax=Lottiidibacillus patelloidae TaxID=2670334 RepID=A0A263BQC8_9BACI|nr:NADH:flavin oxidoreductase/NADH oxidase family protein [Lottiidibacillus patelloidae]OZM55941.1 NADH oxidase [Lottiidibacillus patelloidae]